MVGEARLKIDIRNYKFELLLFSISLIKITYYATRPIFESGPDANTYMPAAIAFAELGYLSKDIPGLPLYPTGYSIMMSLLIRVFDMNWILATQIVQVILFAIATILVRRILTNFFSANIGSVSAYLLLLSPAWFVATGEAMYETMLYFFMTASLYFYLKTTEEKKVKLVNNLIGSSFAVVAIATHPRVLIVFVSLGLFFVYKNKNDIMRIVENLLMPMGVVLSGVAILGYLSYLRTGIFTLSTAFWASMSYNDALKGCYDTSCVVVKIFAEPTNFFRESFLNFVAFWSPHSGSLARGTWFHNVSFLSQLEKQQFTQIAAFIGIVFSIVVVGSWMLGSFLLFRNLKNRGAIFVFLMAAGFIFTDVLIYGDNRHRLIALLFMVPAHAVTLETCLRPLQRRSFRLHMSGPVK